MDSDGSVALFFKEAKPTSPLFIATVAICLLILFYIDWLKENGKEKRKKHKRKNKPKPSRAEVPAASCDNTPAYLRGVVKKISDTSRCLQRPLSSPSASHCKMHLNDLMAAVRSAQNTAYVVLLSMVPTRGSHVQSAEEPHGQVDVEVLNSIMMLTEEGFSKLASEMKSKEKEISQDVARFLGQSLEELERAIPTFSRTAVESEIDGQTTETESRQDEANNGMKDLLKTLMFLDNLSFEMENHYNNIQYLDRRLEYVTSKLYQLREVTNESATQKVEKMEEIWGSATRWMSCRPRIPTDIIFNVFVSQNRQDNVQGVRR